MKFYSKELDILYSDLVDEFVAKMKTNLKKYSLIYPKVPSGFQRTQLMVCGRATNGWEQGWDLKSFLRKKGAILDDAKKEALNCWTAEDFEYHKKRAFFRITKRLIQEHCGIKGDKFASSFIWSNLSKIAPMEGGNPNESEFDAQVNGCKKIFKYELDHAQPKNVVLFAGAITDVNNWAYDFIDHLELSPKKKKSHGEIVAVYEYGPTKIVHVVRPEIKKKGRTEDDIYSKIIANLW